MPLEKVLVVEDDGIIAASMQSMLVAMGYCPIGAVSSGEAAVEAVRANSPSIVLMDIKLAGDIDGIDAAAKISTFSDVPVIYLTAFNNDSTLAKAKITAPYGYLIKPVSDRELRASIEMASSRYELHRKLIESEKALRESEERHTALLDLGDRIGEAIIMLYDDNGRQGLHFFASPRWQAITGYTESELQNLSIFDIIHPRDRTAVFDEHSRRMFCEVLPDLREFTIIRRDGAEISVESTFAFSVYRGRQVDIGYLRDITYRKKLEERLIITDRLATVGDMAFSIGHELNGPLSTVIGWTDLLLESTNLPQDAPDALKVISKETHRAADIIRRLMLFAHSRNQSKTMVDINQLVSNLVDLRSYEQKLKNITINIELAGNLPKVWSENYRLQQVFLDILINSEYFMSEANKGGTLQISTTASEKGVKIVFADDGPGLASENLDGLIGSFFSPVPGEKGYGLSMGLCKQMLKEIGGEITVNNRAGNGTAITIELPGGSPENAASSE